MLVQMTNKQLETLIAALTAGGGTAGAATVIGQMPPVYWEKTRSRGLRGFKIGRDAETKIKGLGLNTDEKKRNFLRSCAGHELNKFWEKEARVRCEPVHEDNTRNIEVTEAHTYEEIIKETNNALLKLVNRDRAIINI